MKPVKDQIEYIKKNGYELIFETVFENAFTNYKKIALYAGSMLLLFSFIFMILLTLLVIAIFGVATVTEFIRPENLKPETFTGNFLLIYTSVIIFLTCLFSPFQAGFLKMADCAQKGEEFHIANIFEYYKFPYFGNIFFAVLLISIFSSGLSVLLDLAGLKSLGMFTSLIISFVTFLTTPLIIFGKLNAIDSITSSVSIILKQPWTILALIVVAFIASLTGLIGFCIGVFFTLPIVYSMQYSIYKSIIDMDYASEIDQIANNQE